MSNFNSLQFDIQSYLHTRDIQNLNCWIYSEFEKGNHTKAALIKKAKVNMVRNKIKWIEKGIVGRWIYKYLGI